MKITKDISVIIPIYGVEKYIEKCLRSLFTQTKTEGVEFILVNDCTKDDSILISEKIIAEFPNLDIKILHHETNSGLACARHTGVCASIGEYIQHIDSDDWVEPTMLEELYAKAKEENADIVACDYYYDKLNHSSYIKMPIPSSNSIDCLKAMLSIKLTQSLCFKLVKRSLYLQENVTYYIKGVDTWEDLLASVKLYYFAKSVTHVNKAFYHYVNISTSSISRSGFSQRKLDNILDATTEISNFLLKSPYADEFSKSVDDRKIYAKYTLLRKAEKLQKKYTRYFPEIDKHILKQKGMPLHNRIALFFAAKGQVQIFNLIISIVKFVKQSYNLLWIFLSLMH